jgi:hypothetical protein
MRQPAPPSCAIEPDRRLRQTLLCAGLVSIELEDANADPDHSGFCGARALQRQSGDQSLRTGEPLRERSQLQSLQSLQLRAEQRRDRPLRAGSATAGRGGEAFVGRHRSVWVFLGRPHSVRKPLFMRVGFPWISLDSLVRIETYQWVARDFPRKFFRKPCLGARSRNGLLRSRPFGRAELLMGKLTSISDCQQSIVGSYSVSC